MPLGAEDTTVSSGMESSDMPSAGDILAYLGGDEDGTPSAAVADPEPETYEAEPEAEDAGGEEEGEPEAGEGDEAEVESDEDASGDGTPATDDKRSRFIPRDRFDEVNRKYRETEARLKELEAWAPVHERIGQLMTAEEAQAQLDQFLSQQAPAAPVETAAETVASSEPPTDDALAAEFHSLLEARGIEVEDMDPATYWANQTAFVEARKTAHLQQQALERVAAMERAAQQSREQAEAARQQAAHQMELRRVTDQYPQFKSPVGQQALAAFALGFGLSLKDAADQLATEFNVTARNQLAEAAVKTAQETKKRPVVPGAGRTPSPSRVVDYSNADNRKAAVEAALAAAGMGD